jgi:hypothetical protein
VPVVIALVVGDGDKLRPVRAILGPPPVAKAARREERSPVSPPAPAKRSLAGWAVPIGLGTLAAGALVFGGVTRLRLGSEVDDLETACSPRCEPALRSGLEDDLAVANIALAVGLGSAVLAAASWFLLAPRESKTSSAVMRSGLAW